MFILIKLLFEINAIHNKNCNNTSTIFVNFKIIQLLILLNLVTPNAN